ncbi:hypothetical protein GVN16_14710 [Emticicia sp. CRIBPO]|uniref:hypothetical protein n=1 Tax=Emticicia sp. CRIBPO TaxID=2683258 RepID=UPI0014130756|nr:hypothetical protein [Emticicia sp. CRIBPO]NBA87021.1 hypothetical protein [Emticicia sp. CRIBPO]
MKKILLASALIFAFYSCKKEEADPIQNQEDQVQLSKVKSSLLNKNGIKVSSSEYELIYDATGKKVEKVNKKYELFTQTGQLSDTQSGSFLIDYKTGNTAKGIQVLPGDPSKPYITAAKYNFVYAGETLDSYQIEGSTTVSFVYNETGNIVKRKSGTSENTYTYQNNTLTYSGGAKFEFSEFKNPLSTMDKGLAIVLGPEFYAGNSEAVNFYAKFPAKFTDPGTSSNNPPSPANFDFKVTDSKSNYPLRAQIVKTQELNPGNALTTVIEYEYKNL